MTQTTRLQPATFYHIYNRGISGENLFVEERNYGFFLKKYAYHIEPVAETYAYCLLRNHLHLLVRIRTEAEQRAYHEANAAAEERAIFKPRDPSQQFSNLFNAYAKAINKAYGRHGTLFTRPFKRIEVKTASYFATLVVYIHRNAQHHGFVDDFRDWPYSSFRTVLAAGPTRLQREAVLDWFGGRTAFLEVHDCDDGDLAQELRLED